MTETRISLNIPMVCIPCMLSVLAYGILLLASQGCSSTIIISDEIPADEQLESLTYEQLNTELEDRWSTIVLQNGQTIRASRLQVTASLTTHTLSGHTTADSIATSAIARIESLNREHGLLLGLLYGAAGGAVIGAIAQLMDRDNEWNNNTAVWVALGCLGGGLIGAVPGMIAGGILGHRNIYIPANHSLVSAPHERVSDP